LAFYPKISTFVIFVSCQLEKILRDLKIG